MSEHINIVVPGDIKVAKSVNHGATNEISYFPFLAQTSDGETVYVTKFIISEGVYNKNRVILEMEYEEIEWDIKL